LKGKKPEEENMFEEMPKIWQTTLIMCAMMLWSSESAEGVVSIYQIFGVIPAFAELLPILPLHGLVHAPPSIDIS